MAEPLKVAASARFLFSLWPVCAGAAEYSDAKRDDKADACGLTVKDEASPWETIFAVISRKCLVELTQHRQNAIKLLLKTLVCKVVHEI